jgi:DNA repair exonuclease SbcCD nuclease subunit
MKLAIVSDLHIGYERFSEDAYKQAREALESAAEEGDAIIIAGDVFDKRAPKPEIIAQAINIFRDISRKEWKAHVSEFRSESGNKAHTNVPIIAIPGTHERVAEGKDNVLKLLALAGLMVDVSESVAIIELNGEKVAISGLGGVSEERVKEALEKLNPKPVPDAFNVFVLHQSIYELLPFNDNVIRYADLPKGFDLYVNGHIHNRVEATVHGKKFLIPGSTVLTQLKDGEQEGKGFILFDTKTYSHEFRKIKSREFVSVKLNFNDATPKELSEKCEVELEKVMAKCGDMPIIKLKLEGKISKGFTNADLPLRSLISKYSARAFFEIDSSKLKSQDSEDSIESVRDGLIGGMTVRELGLSTFTSKLKENKFDENIDASKLFEILSSDLKKEKVIEQATELLSGED